jgi:hypothetical protein
MLAARAHSRRLGRAPGIQACDRRQVTSACRLDSPCPTSDKFQLFDSRHNSLFAHDISGFGPKFLPTKNAEEPANHYVIRRTANEVALKPYAAFAVFALDSAENYGFTAEWAMRVLRLSRLFFGHCHILSRNLEVGNAVKYARRVSISGLSLEGGRTKSICVLIAGLRPPINERNNAYAGQSEEEPCTRAIHILQSSDTNGNCGQERCDA